MSQNLILLAMLLRSCACDEAEAIEALRAAERQIRAERLRLEPAPLRLIPKPQAPGTASRTRAPKRRRCRAPLRAVGGIGWRRR